MTLSADGWVSWAKRVPGIPDKVYSQRNSAKAFACHSVVGREDEFSDGVPNRFLDTSRLPNGRYTPNAEASVQFVLRESGLLIQMYPIYASTWTSGGPEANTSCMSMEAEGGLAPNYGEPLTAAAEEMFCKLMVELRPVMGLAQPGVNLFQHKELARMYGYAPTACASDRYANAWSRAVREAQEDEMTPDQINALIDKRIKEKQDSGALASTTDVLSCVAQIVGVDKLTYTDTEKVAAVRGGIARMRNGA